MSPRRDWIDRPRTGDVIPARLPPGLFASASDVGGPVTYGHPLPSNSPPPSGPHSSAAISMEVAYTERVSDANNQVIPFPEMGRALRQSFHDPHTDETSVLLAGAEQRRADEHR